MHAGVPPTLIQQVTGHKNVASISNYAIASKSQQKAMQDILANQAPSTSNLLSQSSTMVPSKVPAATTTAPYESKAMGIFTGAALSNCKMNINFSTENNQQNLNNQNIQLSQCQKRGKLLIANYELTSVSCDVFYISDQLGKMHMVTVYIIMLRNF